jgi:carbon-monoxide dehydrogenase medium subunit
MGVGFHRPANIGEAIDLIATDAEARFVAGGQTLVAMMNAGLVQPSSVILLAGVPELRGVEPQGDGGVRIGGMTTHAQVAASVALTGGHAVVREAAAVIGHQAIRNFGTIGGSVCHGDSAADLPAALIAAEAEIELAGPNGRRTMPARQFFVGYLTTALAADEILVAIVLPPGDPAAIGHYLKFARVDGDYATVSVAIAATVEGVCSRARVALGSCGPRPVHSDDADAALEGGTLAPDDVAKAADALLAVADPMDDTGASAAYRRRLVPRLLASAVAELRDRAGL